MPTSQHFEIAIVGAGPAGCYLTQGLLRGLTHARVTLFDRLTTPFGLVRYGVAADHQHTKAISRQFARLFQDERVRFAGNVEVGTDVSVEQLLGVFDVVVLATGLSGDRKLGIPGENLPGVIGSGTLTRLLNSHPLEAHPFPRLGDTVLVIGGGNVAIDALRFLVKGASDYDMSDIADTHLSGYLNAPASRVIVAQRADAAHSKADATMIKELAALPRASYRTPEPLQQLPDPEADRAVAARLDAYGALFDATRPAAPGPVIEFVFEHTPTRFLGDDRVTAVEFISRGETVTIEADAVITAVGFEARTEELGSITGSASEESRLSPRLYRTGWAKRGPVGAIPENRACAKTVAEDIMADITSASCVADPTRTGFEGLPAAISKKATDYAGWIAIDAYEREQAPENRVRNKLADHHTMVALTRGHAPHLHRTTKENP